MERKPIIILSICAIIGTLIVFSLYAATKKVLHEPSSFLRTYKHYVASKKSEFDLGFNSYYIAGITADRIYLSSITAPFHMVSMNHELADTLHIKLKVWGMDTLTFYNPLTVKIDSPYFFIADGSMPGIFRGKIGEWVAERYFKEKEYFSRVVPISTSSFAIRTNYAKTREHVLGKLQMYKPHIKIDTTLLRKQIDGFFCTDGMLNYNRELSRLIYTYYYRNEFIVYDTNLNLKFRGHTIDTFSRADIKIGHIVSEGTNTLTYKRLINRGVWTSGDFLFINSNLLAKNDTKNMFPMMTIIDVYNVVEDKYKFSFTFPNIDAETKTREFRVIGDKTMIVLAGDYIVLYDLKQGFFDDLNL